MTTEIQAVQSIQSAHAVTPLSSDPNRANAALDTASAASISGTLNSAHARSPDLAAQTAIDSLPTSPELTSAATQQSLLAQLEANMASALYLKAALFRSQHDADSVSPNAGREPQPEKPIPELKPVILSPFEGSL
ncbi:MAG: hypothetical protein WC100_15905 [Sterolibacterium sp.]